MVQETKGISRNDRSCGIIWVSGNFHRRRGNISVGRIEEVARRKSQDPKGACAH
jgi:hypothetical protein